MAWSIDTSKEELVFVMEAGMFYRDLRRFDDAREIFNGVRILAPMSEVPEVALGTVAFQDGEFERAGMHYRRALKLNPRSAWAYAHLGELSLFQMDKEQARRHLNSAIDLDPRGDHGKLARALLDFADVVNFK
jgi:tetratricopeptide (TPR) repeat protein